ncbi:hypothetical protein BH10ACT9_BH10ACT9_45980 [soil metagenome]
MKRGECKVVASSVLNKATGVVLYVLPNSGKTVFTRLSATPFGDRRRRKESVCTT